jgi:membrane protease subunit HflK
MFYETMEEILPSLKVVINSSNGNVQTILPIDSLATINTSSQASDTGSQASQSTDN